MTTPNEGDVTTATGTPAGSPPSGYAFLGQQTVIAAPDAAVAQPLVLVFRIDASALPPGLDPATVTVARNGTPAANCSASDGSATPDPCVASRQVLSDGDLQITVRSSHASTWTVLRATPVGPRPTRMTANPVVASFSPLTVFLAPTAKLEALNPTVALAGKKITFRVGTSVICTATTAANGTAKCSGLVPLFQSVLALGRYTARFDGDTSYEAASATGALLR